MQSKLKTLILAAIVIALLVGAAALYRSYSEKGNEALPDAAGAAENGDQAKPLAPDFTMLDAEGNSVKFSDTAGKPRVLNFWASWCGPCKSEMPLFDAAAAEFSDRVDFLMVNLTDGSRETVESASSYIAEAGYTFPVYYDTLSEGASAYSVRSIPTTYFISADGTIEGYAAGSLRDEMLRQGINLILD